ncbi:MAG: hypothetical protein QM756_02325 [Polyangiaceae bacterium]
MIVDEHGVTADSGTATAQKLLSNDESGVRGGALDQLCGAYQTGIREKVEACSGSPHRALTNRLLQGFERDEAARASWRLLEQELKVRLSAVETQNISQSTQNVWERVREHEVPFVRAITLGVNESKNR